jgi:hypothetical protein
MITRKKLEQLSLALQESMVMYMHSDRKIEIETVTVQEITMRVCEYFEVDIKNVLSGELEREFTTPRFFAMYFIRRLLPKISLKRIANYFGRHHSSVINARRELAKVILSYHFDEWKEFHLELCQMFKLDSSYDLILMEQEFKKLKPKVSKYIKKKDKPKDVKIVPFVRESGWTYSNKNHCAV